MEKVKIIRKIKLSEVRFPHILFRHFQILWRFLDAKCKYGDDDDDDVNYDDDNVGDEDGDDDVVDDVDVGIEEPIPSFTRGRSVPIEKAVFLNGGKTCVLRKMSPFLY